jgi:hypothetical protein
MDLLQASELFLTRADEVAFILSLVVTGLFYTEYKKYKQQVEREEMLDNFLKD